MSILDYLERELGTNPEFSNKSRLPAALKRLSEAYTNGEISTANIRAMHEAAMDVADDVNILRLINKYPLAVPAIADYMVDAMSEVGRERGVAASILPPAGRRI